MLYLKVKDIIYVLTFSKKIALSPGQTWQTESPKTMNKDFSNKIIDLIALCC